MPQPVAMAPPSMTPSMTPPTGPGAVKAPSTSSVVQVVHSKAIDAKGRLVQPTVKTMVDLAVMELTGKKSAKEAWSSMFSPKEKVGLKPNMLGRQVHWTNTETVVAVYDGLLSAGVRPENIYMWDLKSFDISPLFKHFRRTKVNIKTTRDWGFGAERFKIDSGPPTTLVKPLLKVDAVVNIPLIKDHGIAGVTCALKSVLGSIHNPRDYHSSRKGGRTCDPTVPELSALPAVRSKMRLILTDGFFMTIDGGPRPSVEGRRQLNSVFAATDPVAMDRVAWTLIDQQRKVSKMEPLMKRAKGRPTHVLTAEKMGLGIADPKRIRHLVKTLG